MKINENVLRKTIRKVINETVGGESDKTVDVVNDESGEVLTIPYLHSTEVFEKLRAMFSQPKAKKWQTMDVHTTIENEDASVPPPNTIAHIDAAFDKMVEWVADGLESWVEDNLDADDNEWERANSISDAAWDLANGAVDTFSAEARVVMKHDAINRAELASHIAEVAVDEYEARSIGK
jgi:hypothetical protein